MTVEDMKNKAGAKKDALVVKSLSEKKEFTGTGVYPDFKDGVKYMAGVILGDKLKAKGYLK